MAPDIRRIVAVDAHRRRTGHCPLRIYSLGTGETFEISPRPDGFTDLESGRPIRSEPTRIVVPGSRAIAISLDGDIGFSGIDPASGAAFSGRAGGGTSVTIYEADDFFQYAIVTSAQPLGTQDEPPANLQRT
jgi:hypothetical protein